MGTAGSAGVSYPGRLGDFHFPQVRCDGVIECDPGAHFGYLCCTGGEELQAAAIDWAFI